MTTQAELKKEQVDNLEMTISITMRVSQWNHIADELDLTLKSPGWTGTKADFIRAIRQTVRGMTDRTNNKYPPIPLP